MSFNGWKWQKDQDFTEDYIEKTNIPVMKTVMNS
jgi:hypothetical protein